MNLKPLFKNIISGFFVLVFFLFALYFVANLRNLTVSFAFCLLFSLLADGPYLQILEQPKQVRVKGMGLCL